MFVAIIPLRRGSQRVKNKNLKKILNKPLYTFIINSALKSKLIYKIIINTDINEIKKKYINNKKIIFKKRKKKLAGNCNMNDVINDTIYDLKYKYFIQLHATSPFLSPTSIDKYLKKFLSQKKYDSFFSVSHYKKRLWSSKKLPFNHSINDEPTTQNLINLYEENSSFYIFTKDSFYKNYNRIGLSSKMIKLNKIESFDIDNNEDFQFIEYIAKLNDT